MRRVILLVEEPPGQHNQVAHILVLRAHAQHQRVLDHSAAKADAVVRLQHRRRGHDAWHLRQHGLLVFAGQEVVVLHLLGPDCAAAGVLDFNLVGPDLLNLVQDELPAREADGDHQDHRGRSDDHAQRRQGKAQLAGAEAVEASFSISLSSMVRRALSRVCWNEVWRACSTAGFIGSY